MTSLTRFFFRAPYSAPRSREIWQWWESRRPVYNFAVIAAGITTLISVYLAELLIGGSTKGVPWVGIVIYGILANLFYTLGPIIDAFVMRRWGRDYSEVGPTLFRYGFVFAVGLTLLPVVLSGLRVILGMIF
ncbi:MAG TPA: hypothetical protein VIQ98_02090 [Gemmatimonadales bacterium]